MASVTPVDALTAPTMPIGVDTRNAASVQQIAQWAADHALYLKNRSGALVDADIAALQARTAPSNGHVIRLPGRGLYYYDTASVEAEAHPFIVKPTSITHPDPGRYIHENKLLVGAASGFALLDSSSKLKSGHLDFRLIARTDVESAALFSTTASGGTWDDVTTCSITLASLVIGDKIDLDFSGTAYTDLGAGKFGVYKMMVDRPVSADADIGQAHRGGIEAANVVASVVMQRTFTVTEDGSHTFKVQAQQFGTCTFYINQGASFRARLWRAG